MVIFSIIDIRNSPNNCKKHSRARTETLFPNGERVARNRPPRPHELLPGADRRQVASENAQHSEHCARLGWVACMNCLSLRPACIDKWLAIDNCFLSHAWCDSQTTVIFSKRRPEMLETNRTLAHELLLSSVTSHRQVSLLSHLT